MFFTHRNHRNNNNGCAPFCEINFSTFLFTINDSDATFLNTIHALAKWKWFDDLAIVIVQTEI